MKNKGIRHMAVFMALVILGLPFGSDFVTATLGTEQVMAAKEDHDEYAAFGGGYAATGQISGLGYTTEVYDATNGLPTSDAMFLLASRDGRMWIGGYAGVICHDGTTFERLDTSEGLTSARGLFEDTNGRIWVGTNDNGVVVTDGKERTHLTYLDGLPSSSIRNFAEDKEGNIFIGTTAGVCYVDAEMKVRTVSGADLSEERILKLDADSAGKIYGQASGGLLFSIENCAVSDLYESKELGMEKATTIMADPDHPGMVYVGTEGNSVYYGHFGDAVKQMERISLGDLKGVHWINYDCGRIWISSSSVVGYLDENRQFQILDRIPITSGIEMVTSDYQGNLWIASSTQGVMKLVTNHFVDMTGETGHSGEVANAACLFRDQLYVGTDSGLLILDRGGKVVENELTEHIGTSRVRCIAEDGEGNLWIATYTNNIGLICYSVDGTVKAFTTENGMPANEVRCVIVSADGSILAGTNGGLAEIRDGKVVRTVGSREGVNNTVFLTVAQAPDGSVLAGSDGDGIYVIRDKEVQRLGRADGLTSEVVMRILWDDRRDLFWLVTSNSIEFMKDGKITQVTSFPYNNNYDIYFDDKEQAWILSSYGIYCVSTDELLRDEITDYKLYTVENGLPYSVTANSYSAKDEEGNLYVPGRNGVIRLNVNQFEAENQKFLTDVKAIYCDDERIYPNENGVFQIPVTGHRVQIYVSLMDYTMLNPTVRVYLEGGPDEGIIVEKSKLSSLEYTNLSYGNYTLHVQVVNKAAGDVLQDDAFKITKRARIDELWIVRVLVMILIAGLVGFGVWRFLRSTTIARQYEELRKAKEEVLRANTAKSRFLANISHELRAPVNFIIGTNELAMREEATGVPKPYFLSMLNYAFDIRNASETLLRLINDLIEISRVESGQLILEPREYDVQTMLGSVISMTRIRCEEKKLSFDAVIDEMLPRRMYGDIGKIKQIIVNLLVNAVKFTDMGGIVFAVSLEERDGDNVSLRFSVKDTGMGIRKEDGENLFTAYEKLDKEQGEEGLEAGMGFDLSRRFAELMDGKLWYESVYGEGTELLFLVSQKIVDDTPIGRFEGQDYEPVRGAYVPLFIAPDADVLVVDDNPVNLNMVKSLLSATKVFITTAKSGEEALDKIRSDHFDIVFLDQVMPGMDGTETIEKIRAFDQKLPVYALTSNMEDGEDFFRKKGFNGCLLKPVDGMLLEKMIMRHLPDEMMEKIAKKDAEELPEDMRWLYETKGISVSEGMKNSGGVQDYLYALRLFLDTIDDNVRIIRETRDGGDDTLFSAKVRVLKRSARIIGATKLCDLAGKLEEAIKRQDKAYCDQELEKLLTNYEAYKEKLSRLKQ